MQKFVIFLRFRIDINKDIWYNFVEIENRKDGNNE